MPIFILSSKQNRAELITDCFDRIGLGLPVSRFTQGPGQSRVAAEAKNALREGGAYRMVRDIAANMLLLTNVMNETKQIEEQASL